MLQESDPHTRSISDKYFYKEMQKLKDRGNNAVPPKKSASAYIIFGKEVSQGASTILHFYSLDVNYTFITEKSWNIIKKSNCQGYWSSQGNCTKLGSTQQGRQVEI